MSPEATFDRLLDYRGKLLEHLGACRPEGLVWECPNPARNDEILGPVDRPEIPAKMVPTETIGDVARTAFCDYSLDHKSNFLYVRRHPGVLRVSDSCAEVGRALNHLKSELWDQIHLEASRKNISVQQVGNYIMGRSVDKRAVYRKIHFVPDGTEYLSFYWRNPGVKQRTVGGREEAAQVVNKSQPVMEDADRIKAIQLEAIAEVTGNPVFVRRQIASPRPQVQPCVYDEEGHLEHLGSNITATVPLFTTDPLPEVRPLGNYKYGSGAQRRRLSQRQYFWISKDLGLAYYFPDQNQDVAPAHIAKASSSNVNARL